MTKYLYDEGMDRLRVIKDKMVLEAMSFGNYFNIEIGGSPEYGAIEHAEFDLDYNGAVKLRKLLDRYIEERAMELGRNI